MNTQACKICVQILRQSIAGFQKFTWMPCARRRSAKASASGRFNSFSDEIKKVNPQAGRDESLNEEKRVEQCRKTFAVSEDAYALLYENTESTVGTLEKPQKSNWTCRIRIEFSRIHGKFADGAGSLAIGGSVRDFAIDWIFAERLEEIENRMAEISRLKRNTAAHRNNFSALQESEESEKHRNRWTARRRIAKKLSKFVMNT